MKGLRFAILHGGYGYNDIAWNFQGYGLATAETKEKFRDVWQEFSFLYVLIEHPQAGYLMYDVGLGPGEPEDRRPLEHRQINPVTCTSEQYVDGALATMGLGVQDISAIIISHCHWDHIGGLEFFRGTEAIQHVYVPEKDFAHALVQSHRNSRGYADSVYYRKNLDVEGADFTLIEEEGELFPGIEVLLLDGHCPQVAGLVLHLEGGTWIFPSDAVTAEICLRGEAKPGVIYDSLGFERTRRRLLKMERELDAKFVFPHDPWNFPEYALHTWIE